MKIELSATKTRKHETNRTVRFSCFRAFLAMQGFMGRVVVFAVTLMAAASVSAQTAPQKIVVVSPTLIADQRIPRDYTPDGRNLSPPLTWSQVPAGTKELAVICEDPDAGNPPPFTHWVVYKIPATAKGLPEGLPIDPAAAMPAEIGGAIQGVSGFRRPIYRGPAPPPGKPHHYHFVVYALDSVLDLKPGLNRAELLAAIQGHIIGQGELVAIYER
jgi:Raf kinase inhibitor-like YbhB/YbcL family protein